ncbi:MAG: MvaI/BcnI restriction endonuclease family protein, partial [Pyrinomonadaceae bacterium]|nr:MvaI/BcnI restriction endonuclease family protein [Pyrinomonadaceae bacterium]
MALADLQGLFADAGYDRLYAKPLSKNDDRKHGVYFGPGFEALNLFPNQGVVAVSRRKDSIFKSKLNFGWLLENGAVTPAPNAQLILYPQYPEVRLSGFLRGCSSAPSALMSGGMTNRVIFLGVISRGEIVGFVAAPRSQVAAEFRAKFLRPTIGVFFELPLPHTLGAAAARRKLMRELRRISQLGWIDSKQLASTGALLPCNALQCGGLTLEAELGIPKNSRAEPDFHGWEVKQHNVANFDRVGSAAITLMTPEPTGGYYQDQGPAAFVRKFGYADKSGVVDRLNFGGVHRIGHRHSSTHLILTLMGYDEVRGVITDSKGAIELLNDRGVIAASWKFDGLLEHWTRKHAKAAFVPSQGRTDPRRQYRYGHQVRMAIGTDFLRFLKGMANGMVYYDPGIKLEQA